jgi:hypothetical protein
VHDAMLFLFLCLVVVLVTRRRRCLSSLQRVFKTVLVAEKMSFLLLICSVFVSQTRNPPVTNAFFFEFMFLPCSGCCAKLDDDAVLSEWGLAEPYGAVRSWLRVRVLRLDLRAQLRG